MTACLGPAEALAFVRQHGIVLASARGPAPRLTDAIVGEPVEGHWWTHAKGREIYAVLRAVSESDEVLVCRLIGGKVTLVHRRLWPLLVRIADRFEPRQLAQVRDEHTASGRHVSREVRFPGWVPPEVLMESETVDEQAAVAAFRAWLPH